MKDINNVNNLGLDYAKINELLSDPEFANWYYNYVTQDGDSSNINIENFVQLINDYNNKFS